MRQTQYAALALTCALALAAGCTPTYPACSNDSHCEARGEYCLRGQCTQCSKDIHCKNSCVACSAAGRCERIPDCCQSNADCPKSLSCLEGKCDCGCWGDSDCERGQMCSACHCVPKPSAP